MSEYKPKTTFEQLDEDMERAIDAKRHQTREVLKEVEKTFQTSIQAHIDYHKFLMNAAKERNDILSMNRHLILMETYESILKNYSLSGSYDNK